MLCFCKVLHILSVSTTYEIVLLLKRVTRVAIIEVCWTTGGVVCILTTISPVA